MKKFFSSIKLLCALVVFGVAFILNTRLVCADPIRTDDFPEVGMYTMTDETTDYKSIEVFDSINNRKISSEWTRYENGEVSSITTTTYDSSQLTPSGVSHIISEKWEYWDKNRQLHGIRTSTDYNENNECFKYTENLYDLNTDKLQRETTANKVNGSYSLSHNILYNEEGKKYREENWSEEDGISTCKSTEYDSDGKIYKKSTLQCDAMDGTLIGEVSVSYSPNGDKTEEVEIKVVDGIRTRDCIEYDTYGNICGKHIFKSLENGQFINEVSTWYSADGNANAYREREMIEGEIIESFWTLFDKKTLGISLRDGDISFEILGSSASKMLLAAPIITEIEDTSDIKKVLDNPNKDVLCFNLFFKYDNESIDLSDTRINAVGLFSENATIESYYYDERNQKLVKTGESVTNNWKMTTIKTPYLGKYILMEKDNEPEDPEPSNTVSGDEPDTRISDAIDLSIASKRPVEVNGIQTLSIDDMQKLKDNPSAIITLNYTYMGRDYKVTLYGRNIIVDPTIPWYGPLYLAGKYGNVMYASNVAGTYVIKPGDTLSKIAASNGTTVSAIMALNPYVINQNIIYSGRTLLLK